MGLIMASGKIITLLTDFGDRDVYVGVMKGAIAQIDPQLKTIDPDSSDFPTECISRQICFAKRLSLFP